MIKFGLFSVNADLFLTSLAQKVRIRTFSANADHSGSTAYSRFLEFEINNVGLHSDGRTTKGRATYNRTTNYRTKVRWSVSCLDLCAVV